jgi:hypothetical protein
MPAPLDAESVFFGGDYWLTLFAQHRAPPKQSKRKHPSSTFPCLYQIVFIQNPPTTLAVIGGFCIKGSD